MNHAIKFRYWDHELQTFVYSDEFDLETQCFRLEAFFAKANLYAYNAFLQQFSGLLDKNEKEIYEGDILRSENIFKKSDYEFYFCEYEINFSTSAFVLKNKKKNWNFGGESKMLEIVGNIFDNPQLLA